jgi:hypothetical protein
VNAAVYHEKLSKALARAGGLYTLNDILERCADGRMQSFTCNNSWVVTQISVYPQARVIDIIALVGDLDDGENLHKQVFDFAAKHKVDAIIATGRTGWARLAKSHGWKTVSQNMVFRKEVSP